MIEIFALEVDLGAAELLRQAFGEIQRRRPPDIMGKIVIHFLLIGRIGLGVGIGLLQFKD
jgi:hypothetical protein